MIVQWCCKGVAKLDRGAATKILEDGIGLRCRDWLELGDAGFRLHVALDRLTEANLDRHVHDYARFCRNTPFISLSAGCVDRNTTMAKNVTEPALRAALEFACTDYTQARPAPCHGWVFVCYVLVGVNPAPPVPAVAEEIRELSHARPYSRWYPQGEVTAKIHVPSTQIQCARRYERTAADDFVETATLLNRRFTHPAPPLDERKML